MGAIFAGALIALGLLILLTLLGIGLGATTTDPAQDANPLSGLGVGSAIWYILIHIVAFLVGGYAAARLMGIPKRTTAILHGVAVWAVVTLITAYLATTTAGRVISGTTSAVTSAAQAAGDAASGIASAASGVDLPPVAQNALDRLDVTGDNIRREAVELANRAGVTQGDVQDARQAFEAGARDALRTPGDLGADFNQLVDRLVSGPDAALSPQERERMVVILGERAGLSPEEAEAAVVRFEEVAQNAKTEAQQALDEAQQTAVEAAGTAMDALAAAAWSAFIVSLIALGAAVGGAIAGTNKYPFLEKRFHLHEEDVA